MDEADIAKRQSDQILAATLASRRQTTAAPSAMTCDECDEPIPEKRRIAVPGCRLCISCQRDLENYGTPI